MEKNNSTSKKKINSSENMKASQVHFSSQVTGRKEGILIAISNLHRQKQPRRNESYGI
jgi:hypothetical protein